MAVTAANTADRQVIDELLDEPATGERAADTGADSGNDSAGNSGAKDIEVYGDRPTRTAPP